MDTGIKTEAGSMENESNEKKEKCEFNADSLIVRADLTITGGVKSVGPAVEQIMRIVSQMNCAAGKEYEIELAVREALANAIVHGCKKDPEKSVQISVGCDESRGMIIVVRDPGGGFDPSQIPSPIVGEQLYSEHGRGIFLINQLMDEVRYRNQGTELWMRKG
jgi:serine/threonine-protein kinase RsbW